jgi:hypothetical protein
MLKQIGNAKVKYSEAAGWTTIVIPLSVVCVTLGGGGHAPILLTLPFLFLFGPLGFLAPRSGMSGFYFALFGPFPLYLLYGLVFAFLSGRSPTMCRLFLAGVSLIHVGIGLVVLYLNWLK